MPWEDVITDERVEGLASDEEAPDVDEELTASEVETTTGDLIDHTDDAAELKERRTEWARKAVDVASDLSLPSRLLILRVMLAFWTAGNWGENDRKPFTLMRNLLRTLRAKDQTVELTERAASLAAIALTVMRQRAGEAVGTEHAPLFQLRFRESRDAVGQVLKAATEETIDAYVTGLRTNNGGILTGGHVLEVLDDLIGGDPLAELETTMEQKGFDVHRPSLSSMHIHKASGKPELWALEAVGSQEHDGIVVWATNDKGNWACIAWRKPDLVSVFDYGARVRWRHQRLKNRTPAAAALALSSALVNNEGTPGLPDVVSSKPKHHMTPAAGAVLAELGVASPVFGPPCCADSEASPGSLGREGVERQER